MPKRANDISFYQRLSDDNAYKYIEVKKIDFSYFDEDEDKPINPKQEEYSFV